MTLLISLLVNTFSIIVAAYLIPHVQVSSFLTALVVAVVLGILNMFVRPIVTLLTLPLTILTLGLFSFVINAVFILIASYFVQGFMVDGFLWALVFGFVVSVINAFSNALIKSS